MEVNILNKVQLAFDATPSVREDFCASLCTSFIRHIRNSFLQGQEMFGVDFIVWIARSTVSVFQLFFL